MIELTAQSALVAVKVDGGLVVWHTREEWERFLRDVDLDASRVMSAVIEYSGRQQDG
jgi:inorganic triphosphatase YgiF